MTHSNVPDSAWKGLYYAGGAAALAAVLLFRRFFSAELMVSKGFGLFAVPETMPTKAAGWFALLQHNTTVGLLLFDVIDLINYALVGVIFLALYGALRQVARSAMTAAVAFTFAGIAVYLASNQAFSMLNLSHRHAQALDVSESALYLAAGEALLATHNPGILYQGTGIYLSFLLVLLAGLVISIAMLRSDVFNKATAYTGILANVFALGYFPFLALAPALVWIPPTISAPFRMIWYVLIAVKLFRLATSINNMEARKNESGS